jgi:hydrogenase maturation protease
MERPSPFPPAGRTVVLGLGNPVLRDDGVGLVVAAAVLRLLEEAPVPGADVLASTRAGFELLDLLRGYRRAILIDCLTLPDPVPGRVHHLSLDDVAGSARLVNAHDLSLGTAFRLAERLGIPMPGEVDIVAVEGADTQTFAEGLTPDVAAAAGPLAAAIHADLLRRAPDGAVPDDADFARRRALFRPEI